MPAAPDVRNAAGPPRRVLVLGGARSGKSRYAQALAENSGRRLVFCATAGDFDDPEMRERIARHRADRDGRWHTVEAPLDLAGALREACATDAVVLVDCLTLWLSNLMLSGGEPNVATAPLLEALRNAPGAVVLVAENALSRRFRDAQGRVKAAVAEHCDVVVLTVAGQALRLKPEPEPKVRLC